MRTKNTLLVVLLVVLLPPDTGALAQNVSAGDFAVVRGSRYAVLESARPGCGSSGGCMSYDDTGPLAQTGSIKLPDGWALASSSDESALLALFLFRWGLATGIVFGDGKSFQPNGITSGVDVSQLFASGQLIDDGGGFYSVNAANPAQHILITQAGQAGDTDAIDQTIPAISGSQILTMQGMDYATILPSQAKFPTTMECRDGWFEMPAEWQVASDSPETRLAVTGGEYFYKQGVGLILDEAGKQTFHAYHSLNYVSHSLIAYTGRRYRAGTGWHVLRLDNCATSPAVFLMSRASSGPDAWQLQQDGTNMTEFVIGLDRYATLDNYDFNAGGGQTCDGVLRAVPEGWELAQTSNDHADEAASAGWNTNELVFAGGATRLANGVDSTSNGGLQAVTIAGTTYYTTTACARRVLIHRLKFQENLNFKIGGKVLVLTPTVNVAKSFLAVDNLAVIESALKAAGVPYDVKDMEGNVNCNFCESLSTTLLDGSNNAKYLGIVATVDPLFLDGGSGTFVSALSSLQWKELRKHMFDNNIRYFSASTDPSFRTGEAFGLLPQGTSTAASSLTFSSVPSFDFHGINAASSSPPMGESTVFRASLDPASGNTVTVLARHDETTAPNNIALATIKFEDFREEMHVFIGQKEASLECKCLGSGILATLWLPWVTRGLYLGQRRQHLNVLVTDLYKGITTYNSSTEYRTSDTDFTALVAKLTDALATLPATSTLMPTLGFHGDFADVGGPTGALFTATSTPSNRNKFYWINQMFNGQTDLTGMTAGDKTAEIVNNVNFATTSLFSGSLGDNFADTVMLTTDNSLNYGLIGNPASMWDVSPAQGITTAIGVNWEPPLAPLPGLPHLGRMTTQAVHGFDNMFLLPRLSSYFFPDASTEAEQQGRQNTTDPLATIVDKFTDEMLTTLGGNFRHDYVQFSQAHFRTLDGNNDSLLSLWIKSYAQKYANHWTLPLLSFGADELKDMFLQRRQREACGLSFSATVEACEIVSVELTSTSSCTALLTGAFSSSFTSSDYGSDHTLEVPVTAGTPVNIVLSTPIRLSSCDLSFVAFNRSGYTTTAAATTGSPPVSTGATTTAATTGSPPVSTGATTTSTSSTSTSATTTASSSSSTSAASTSSSSSTATSVSTTTVSSTSSSNSGASSATSSKGTDDKSESTTSGDSDTVVAVVLTVVIVVMVIVCGILAAAAFMKYKREHEEDSLTASVEDGTAANDLPQDNISASKVTVPKEPRHQRRQKGRHHRIKKDPKTSHSRTNLVEKSHKEKELSSKESSSSSTDESLEDPKPSTSAQKLIKHSDKIKKALDQGDDQETSSDW